MKKEPEPKRVKAHTYETLEDAMKDGNVSEKVAQARMDAQKQSKGIQDTLYEGQEKVI